MKAYTDIEQSKKLAKILPIESADMFYCFGMAVNDKEWSYSETPTIIDKNNNIDVADIPCWSLAALFSVLPNEIIDNHFITLDREDEDYCCYYEDALGNITSTFFMSSDNPVDACVAMILKLNEQNLL